MNVAIRTPPSAGPGPRPATGAATLAGRTRAVIGQTTDGARGIRPMTGLVAGCCIGRVSLPCRPDHGCRSVSPPSRLTWLGKTRQSCSSIERPSQTEADGGQSRPLPAHTYQLFERCASILSTMSRVFPRARIADVSEHRLFLIGADIAQR